MASVHLLFHVLLTHTHHLIHIPDSSPLDFVLRSFDSSDCCLFFLTSYRSIFPSPHFQAPPWTFLDCQILGFLPSHLLDETKGLVFWPACFVVSNERRYLIFRKVCGDSFSHNTWRTQFRCWSLSSPKMTLSCQLGPSTVFTCSVSNSPQYFVLFLLARQDLGILVKLLQFLKSDLMSSLSQKQLYQTTNWLFRHVQTVSSSWKTGIEHFFSTLRFLTICLFSTGEYWNAGICFFYSQFIAFALVIQSRTWVPFTERVSFSNTSNHRATS